MNLKVDTGAMIFAWPLLRPMNGENGTAMSTVGIQVHVEPDIGKEGK
jgi:hypothetical protein